MLSTEEIAGYQEFVNLSFVHKYTKESVSDGSVDTWKMSKPEYDSPEEDLPCNYVSEGNVVTREKGVVQIDTPTISVPPEHTIKTGDRISNIRDANDRLVLAGPLYVDVVSPAMGFGIVTNFIVSLTGQSPVKW